MKSDNDHVKMSIRIMKMMMVKTLFMIKMVMLLMLIAMLLIITMEVMFVKMMMRMMIDFSVYNNDDDGKDVVYDHGSDVDTNCDVADHHDGGGVRTCL